MNKLFKYSMMLATATVVLASCKDEDNISVGEWNANPGYQDVAFEQASLSEELDPADPTQGSIKLFRNTKQGAAVVPIKVLKNTEDVFTIDEVRFADGDSVTLVNFHFDKAEVGKPYSLELFIDDPDFASQYSANTTFNYTVTRVKWNPAGYVEMNGQRYDGYAMYTDDFFTTFWTVENVSWPTLLEERDDNPGYFRMINTYHEGYPYNDPGDWDEEATNYIFIDATNPEKVFIPQLCYIGVDWTYGQIAFHSLAGLRLSQGRNDEAEPYYGTYKNGKITFPEGSLLIGMENYNDFGLYGANSNGAFSLVIDPSQDLYEPAIEEDYVYDDVWTGDFQSGKTGENGSVLLQKGTLKDEVASLAEDDKLAATKGTPYRWVGPYADGYDLYFLVTDDGRVAVPAGYELQPIGRTDNLGTEIFAKIIGGASSFDEHEVVLNITFQNEDGSIVYGTADEVLSYITYTPYATGTVYYNFWSESEDDFTEDPGYTLLQRDDKKDVFMIDEWGMSGFLFQWNQSTNACQVLYQYTGYDYPNYGSVYMVEGALYHSNYAENTSYYDPETKTFHFYPCYFVEAGSFGQFEEIFVITDGGAVKHQATRQLKGAALTGVRGSLGTWKGQKVSTGKKALRQLSNARVIR